MLRFFERDLPVLVCRPIVSLFGTFQRILIRSTLFGSEIVLQRLLIGVPSRIVFFLACSSTVFFGFCVFDEPVLHCNNLFRNKNWGFVFNMANVGGRYYLWELLLTFFRALNQCVSLNDFETSPSLSCSSS